MITTGTGLGIFAALDIPSLKGIGKTRVSSIGVLGRIGARVRPEKILIFLKNGKMVILIKI